jgi:hypothetical protein
MAIPKYDEMMLPVLRILDHGNKPVAASIGLKSNTERMGFRANFCVQGVENH